MELTIFKSTYSTQELETLGSLMGEQWDLGRTVSGYDKDICTRIYLLNILSDILELYTIKLKGEIVGFVGIRELDTLNQVYTNKFNRELEKYDKLKGYYSTYTYQESPIKSDCELSMLILSEKHRGKGIGKRALDFIFNRARELGKNTMEIHTDTACTYKIYIDAGCTKVNEYTVDTDCEPNCNTLIQFIKRLT